MLRDEHAVPDGALSSAARMAALYQSPAWLREHAPKLELAERLAESFYGGRLPVEPYVQPGLEVATSTPERIRS
jgi:hypothetical protein